MSKRPENINFDHFKSQFEEQSNHDLEWNDPPDFIFDDAIAVVNGRKNNENKRKLLLLMSLVLFGVIVGVLLFSHNKVTRLEEKVNLLTVGSINSDVSSSTLDLSSDDTKSLTATNGNSDNTSNKIPAITKVKEGVSNSLTDNIIRDSKSTTAPTDQNKITKLHNSTFSVNNISSGESNNISKSFMTSTNQLSKFNNPTEVKNANLKSKAKNFVSGINALGLKVQKLEIDKKSIELNREISFVETTQKRKAAISFAAIRNFSSFTMNGEFNSPQLLTKYDDFYTGVGYQMALDLPVNSKLSWINSLAYNNINNESYNVNSSSYLKSNEFTTSGSTVYIMNMNVESPVGLLSEAMAIEVDPLLMNEGDLIEDKVNIGQHLSVFSLATDLRYSLLQNNIIDWYAGVSVGGAYISRMTTDMASEVIMNNKTMDSFSSTIESAKNLNSFYSFLELSSGVGYNLNEKYKLNIGLGYSKSLNSLRSNAQGGPSTYLHNWSTTIGISRSF